MDFTGKTSRAKKGSGKGRTKITLVPGTRYGRLTLLDRPSWTREGGGTMWDCVCDCGEERSCYSQYLRLAKYPDKECKSCEKKRLDETRFGRGGLTADPLQGTLGALVHLNQFFTNPVISANQNIDDQNPSDG